jgi:hypothetical protein
LLRPYRQPQIGSNTNTITTITTTVFTTNTITTITTGSPTTSKAAG